MFGEHAGYISTDPEETSEKYNAQVDKQVKDILDESSKRVTQLLLTKEKELREISKNLFYYDYLTAEEIETILKGKNLNKEKVRNWDTKEPQYLIKF